MGWKQGSEQALILTAEAIKGELRPKGNPAPTHHKRWGDTINHIVTPPRTPDSGKDAGRLVWSFQKSSTPDPGRGPTVFYPRKPVGHRGSVFLEFLSKVF